MSPPRGGPRQGGSSALRGPLQRRHLGAAASLALLLAAGLAPVLAGPVPAEEFLTPPEEPPQVVFAGAWPVVLDPFDVGWTGITWTAELMEAAGYEVSLATAPIFDTLDWVRPGDVLVISPVNGVRMSSAELDVIEERVRGGMGLLVLGEHDDFLDTTGLLNPLVTRFGIRFEPVGIVQDEARPHGFLLADFPDLGVEDVQMAGAGKLSLEGGARALAVAGPETTFPGAVLAAEGVAGAGRVAVVADMEMLMNGDPAVGPHMANTSQLWGPLLARVSGHVLEDDAVVRPLAVLATGPAFTLRARVAPGASVAASGHNVALSPAPASPGEAAWDVQVLGDGWVALDAARGGATDRDLVRVLAPPAVVRGNVVLLQDGLARSPHGGPSGLLGLARQLRDAGARVTAAASGDVDLATFDAVLLVAPREDLGALPARLAALPEATRVAVLAEPWSSLDCDTNLCQIIHSLGGVDPPVPLDALAGVMGAHLRAGLACDRAGNAGQVEWPLPVWTTGGAEPVWRAGAVVAEPGGALWEWRVLLEPGWYDHLGSALDNGSMVYEFPAEWRRPRLLLADDARLMAGDTDGATNLHLGSGMADWLVTWLMGRPLRRDMVAGGAAGFTARVELLVAAGATMGAAAARLEESLAPGFVVVDPGGAAEEPQPDGGTRLVWDLAPGGGAAAAYEVRTPLVDAWGTMRARLLVDGVVQASHDAPLRLRAPRLEMRIGVPDVEPLQEVAVLVTLDNVGDDAAAGLTVTQNVSLLHTPWPQEGPSPPLPAVPPTFGDPAAELGVTPDGWLLRWPDQVLGPDVAGLWRATWRAPAAVGTHEVRARAEGAGAFGFGVAVSAAASYEVAPFPPHEE